MIFNIEFIFNDAKGILCSVIILKGQSWELNLTLSS